MNHTQKQLDETWTTMNTPEKRKKALEAENANIPAPKIVFDDEVVQIISLPTGNGASREVYGRRPGGEWVSIR